MCSKLVVLLKASLFQYNCFNHLCIISRILSNKTRRVLRSQPKNHAPMNIRIPSPDGPDVTLEVPHVHGVESNLEGIKNVDSKKS